MSHSALPTAVADATATRVLRVESRTRECDDTVSLELADPYGHDLPAWEPGAHVDVVLGAATVRQYSLCGDPRVRNRWRLGILREPDGRGGSAYLHDEVGPGDLLEVGVPRNNFPLVDAPAYLLLAGGIGVTALLPMAHTLGRRGADVAVVHAGRTRSRMAFHGELAALGCSFHHDDEAGLLPVADLLRSLAPGTAVYCCGPEGLLAAVESTCPSTCELHVERFAPKPVEADREADGPFEVLLRSTGVTVQVAAGQSVLEALGTAGIDVPSSCREGTCASCETNVVDGLVDHRDSMLTDEEREAGETMMICVSRARSERLVLDL